jgi:hypothetical protein
VLVRGRPMAMRPPRREQRGIFAVVLLGTVLPGTVLLGTTSDLHKRVNEDSTSDEHKLPRYRNAATLTYWLTSYWPEVPFDLDHRRAIQSSRGEKALQSTRGYPQLMSCLPRNLVESRFPMPLAFLH